MTQYINKKYALFYFILAMLLGYMFTLIRPYYITDTTKITYGIDASVMKTFCFNILGYIKMAKPYYKNYWVVYFPLDTVYLIVYSLLFLSIADFVRQYASLFKLICVLVPAGAIFDFSENLCVGTFVNSHSDGLATTVAFFTSIKSILFAVNLATAVIILLYAGYRKFFPEKSF